MGVADFGLYGRFEFEPISPEFAEEAAESKMGLARELVYNYCRRERERGRKRLVLTCLPDKVKMYEKFGFNDMGESASEWGGEKWHEMDIRLNF